MSDFATKVLDDIFIVTWSGEKFHGCKENERLREETDGAISNGIKKLIVNFPRVTLIDSSGLGILISAWKNALDGEAELVAVIGSDRVDYILKITNLKSIMKIFRSVEDAMKHFI